MAPTASWIPVTEPPVAAVSYTRMNPDSIPGGALIDQHLAIGGVPKPFWLHQFVFYIAEVLGFIIYDLSSAHAQAIGSLLIQALTIEGVLNG